VRLAIGPRDLENGTIEVARRDTKEKQSMPIDGVVAHIEQLLEDIQQNIYEKALKFREDNTYFTDSFDEFKDILESKGGFIWAHWDGTSETEERIKELTKATIRCIPLEENREEGVCILTGKPSKGRVLFAKAY
jgi:prolyl-tRNA synthetase